MVSQNKTQQTDASVEKFLKSVKDAQRQKDAFVVMELMKKVTKAEPKMWGTAIVGFGKCHMKYDSGRDVDTPIIGFSPRKQNLVLYMMSGYSQFKELMESLGKHKIGKACLYINKIEDIDMKVLEKLMKESIKLFNSRQKAD